MWRLNRASVKLILANFCLEISTTAAAAKNTSKNFFLYFQFARKHSKIYYILHAHVCHIIWELSEWESESKLKKVESFMTHSFKSMCMCSEILFEEHFMLLEEKKEYEDVGVENKKKEVKIAIKKFLKNCMWDDKEFNFF